MLCDLVGIVGLGPTVRALPCGAEPDNSYVAVSLTSPTGNPDLAVSVEVNGQPLPVPIEVKSAFEGSVSYGVYADGYFHVMSMAGSVSGDILM